MVDDFNANTGAWTTTQLSVARSSLAAASLPAQALALFAGGFTDSSGFYSSNIIDIFNGLTGTWSTALLSGEITCAAAASLPALGLAFFTKFGCEPSQWSLSDPHFDVYSTSSVNVSTVQIPVGTAYVSANFAVTSLPEQNLVLFASQSANRDQETGVAIFNAKTGKFAITNFSRPRYWLSATSLPAQGVALFSSSNRYYPSDSTVVDLYNAFSGKWTNVSLPTPREFASLVSLPDQGLVLIGPGNQESSLVDIFDCSSCPVPSQPSNLDALPAPPVLYPHLSF